MYKIVGISIVKEVFLQLYVKVWLSATMSPEGITVSGDDKNGHGHDRSKIPGLSPNYTINEQPIGTRRPIRVACMGAGYSGLMMGIVFSEQMKDKNAELVIYERNEDLGGTWLENR